MTREDIDRAMGPSLGALFWPLSFEVTWIHAKWLEYRKLYGASQERIDVMNEVAGWFFWVVDTGDDVLLHICRLTDPPEQGKGGSIEISLCFVYRKQSRMRPCAAPLNNLSIKLGVRVSSRESCATKRLPILNSVSPRSQGERRRCHPQLEKKWKTFYCPSVRSSTRRALTTGLERSPSSISSLPMTPKLFLT